MKRRSPPSRKIFHLRPGLAAAGAAILLSSAACSSGKTVVGPSSFVKCQLTATAAPTSFPAEGGGGQLTVSTERECAWSAKPGASWVALAAPDSGQGSGSVKFTVATNPDPSPRSAAVTVNDQQVQIAQQAAVCRYQLSSTSANVPSAGGSATIDVTASSAACEWSARSDASWITIREGATGRGNGRIAFDAAPTTGPPRAAAITVADQTVTVTQGDGCAFRIAPASQAVGASGGSGTVTVTAGDGCSWTAASQASWITITAGANGQGNGAVSFSVAGTGGPARTGMLLVAGQTFTVTQSPGCSYTIAPSSATIGADGGSGEVNVTTEAGCGWTAASNAASWISITAGASGSGPGPVRFSVSATTGPARNGTLTIAGRSFTVTQQSGCTTAIDPTSRAFDEKGGSGTVRVTSGAGCEWRTTSSAGWITVRSGATGAGTGDVSFDVAPNSGPARSGTLTIGGRTFTVTQSAGCSYALGADSANVASGGGAGTVSVSAPAGCAWTAAADPAAAWVRITAGASGTGSGPVEFAVDPNPGAARSSTLTIAFRPFTVHQSSGCSYSVTPPSVSLPAAGGSGSVAVSAPGSCTWSASTPTAWLTITSSTSGSGDGSVQFAAAANAGPARSGTIVVAGITVAVDQPTGCTFAIAPASQAFGAADGIGTIAVTAGDGCAWTATRDAEWITISSGASGAGNGSVTFAVAQNTGAPRSGTITVAGQIFTVTQAAAGGEAQP